MSRTIPLDLSPDGRPLRAMREAAPPASDGRGAKRDAEEGA